MTDLVGTLLLLTAGPTGATTGDTKHIRVPHDAPRHAAVQIYIEADPAVTSAVKVTIQGRLTDNDTWIALDKQDDSTEASVTQASGALVDVIFPVQLMPQMRAVTSGTFAATVGNDIEVRILAAQRATRTNS
jgi:hypothetical protein